MDLGVRGSNMQPIIKCSNLFCEVKLQCSRLVSSFSEVEEAMYFEALGDNPCRYFIPKDETEDE